MEIKYLIVYQEKVTKRQIPLLSSNTKLIIKRMIENKLMTDPIGFGKPLRYSLKVHRRLRAGNYRIVYKIDQNIVTIIAIKHRKDIYK